MGNAPSNNLNRPTGITLDSFVSELGTDILYEKSLGSTRFLKAIRARHQYGRIVVKVFVKTDPSFSLKGFVRRLKSERGLLQDLPNVLTYQRAVETEKAGYLIRQWLTNNLYDRISTRPFLSLTEKKWIAFQLLTAMANSWNRGVPHGDLKSENVIVTSWNWVYITDFSSTFKPTYLPEDDPADFSYYFDTSSRRSCYLAPERFYSAETEIDVTSKAKVSESMDVFGLGCVIGELFTEGSSPFTLSQMFNYKFGDYSVEPYLRGIEDEKIRDLVRSMIQLNPRDRLTFEEYLKNCQSNKTFPTSFYIFLHPFLLSMQDLSSPFNPPITPRKAHVDGLGTGPSIGGGSRLADLSPHSKLRNDADGIVEKLWSDFEYVSGFMGGPHKLKVQSKVSEGSGETSSPHPDTKVDQTDGAGSEPLRHSWADFPLRINVPGRNVCLRSTPGLPRSSVDDDVALILLSVLNSNIRSCLYPNSVMKALDLYLALLDHLTDETILDRVLPYLVSLLNSTESCDSIKTSTLLCLTQVLLLVDMITPSNSSLFPEYLIPNLRHLINDPSEFVRATLGKCIGPLALTSKRFLNLTVINQKKRMEPDTKTTSGDLIDTIDAPSYDYNINELHRQFQEIVVSLLTDSSTVTKRSLLTSLPDLSKFFGRVKTNDILLAHILTYLNENDYILRTSFFEHMADIYAEIGPVSVEEYILPMMMQALADSEEFVSTRVITALTEVIKKKLLSEHKLWELIAAVIVLLSHPNSWIRRASTELIVTVSHVLPATDVWCVLYPALRKFLRCDIEDLTKQSILTNLEAPLPRIVYEAAVVWAGRRQSSSFWHLPSAPAKKPQSISSSPSSQSGSTHRQFQTNFLENHALLSEDDTTQLNQLRKIGMTPVDETRLKNMRQHIVKVSDSRSRLPTPHTTLEASNLLDDNNVSLQDFGIPLHNILLKNPSASDHSNLNNRLSSSNHLTARNSGLPGNFQRKISVDITSSSTDLERASSRIDSPTVTDLRRHLVTRHVMSPSMPGTPNHEMHISRPQSCGSSTDVPPLGGLLERSSEITAKPILDSRTPVSNSKGFDVSKTNPAIARDRTSVFGVLDTEGRARQPHVDSSGLGSQVTEHMSSNSPHPRARHTVPPPQRFSSTYEGHDANIRYLLERVFLDSYREPLPEFGPTVAEGIPRRKAFRSFLAVKEKSSRSSSGNLIGHLIEHTAAVSTLCVSPDYVFFASGSHDGTVKVWDTVRLEKNVTSKSRHTFNQGGRITHVCMLEQSHCVASASTNGTLWVHRIDVNFDSTLPSYSKPEAIRQHKLNAGEYITSMIHHNTLTSSDLIYITNKCTIATLDLRTMRTTQVLRNPKHFGPLSRLCVDQKKIWLVVGTGMGYLSLWDLRFGLLLKTWKIADGPIHQLSVHPTQGKGRWVVVAALSTIDSNSDRPTYQTLQVWDLEVGELVQTFLVSRNTSDVAVDRFRAKHEGLDGDSCHYSNTKAVTPLPTQLNASSAVELLLQENQNLKASVKQNIVDLNPSQLLRQPPTVSSFIIGSRHHDNMSSSGELIMMADELNVAQVSSRPAGYLISAGDDRRIRFWDLSVPERSTVVSGLEMEDDRPQFRSDASDSPTVHVEYIAKAYHGGHAHRRPNHASRPDSNPMPHRSTVVANYQQTLLKNHSDAITAIAVIDLPFRCVVSADRTGVIHIYECKDRSRF